MNDLGSLETPQAILWSVNINMRSKKPVAAHRDSTKTSRQGDRYETSL